MSRERRLVLGAVFIPLIKEHLGYRLSQYALLREASGKAIKGAKAGKSPKGGS